MTKPTTKRAPREAKADAPVRVAASTGGSAAGARGQEIEAAMAKAVADAFAEGITDDAVLLERKLAAREQVKREHAGAVDAPDGREGQLP